MRHSSVGKFGHTPRFPEVYLQFEVHHDTVREGRLVIIIKQHYHDKYNSR